VSSDSIEVNCTDRPTEVLLWQATNPDARDFRQEKIGKAYRSTPLTATAPGRYVAKIAAPPKGYTASFIELTYPSGIKYPIKVTTAVKVLPDTYPFPPPNMRGTN
jgi:PhoPQ-activated pathogenicity-related protein